MGMIFEEFAVFFCPIDLLPAYFAFQSETFFFCESNVLKDKVKAIFNYFNELKV